MHSTKEGIPDCFWCAGKGDGAVGISRGKILHVASPSRIGGGGGESFGNWGVQLQNTRRQTIHTLKTILELRHTKCLQMVHQLRRVLLDGS